MAGYDFAAQRLFVEADLVEGGHVVLERPASHYLQSVLRLRKGGEILVFNGRDGEWLAALEVAGRRDAGLRLIERTRPQPPLVGPDLLFAPLKHARLDYMVQKAVEMGVASLRPVLTRRTVATRVNGERMRSNAIEAAEQCGILAVPTIAPEARLQEALDDMPPDRHHFFSDEEAPAANPIEALSADGSKQVALLIGPEGGFDPSERATILARPSVRRLSLGPRILRADTAAVAALALIQAAVGDWR